LPWLLLSFTACEPLLTRLDATDNGKDELHDLFGYCWGYPSRGNRGRASVDHLRDILEASAIELDAAADELTKRRPKTGDKGFLILIG
jgi:hypothetical protein